MPTLDQVQPERFRSFDSTEIYAEWLVPDEPRGLLVFVHGFGEHGGRYRGLAKQANGRGFATCHYDTRGHGRSGGSRGHIFSFSEHVRDLEMLFKRADEKLGECARVLLGHSYGGLIATTTAATVDLGLSGLVLSSPFFGFKVKVPAWKLGVGRVLSRYVPALAMPTGLNADHVCRNPETVEAYLNDPLMTRVATTRWLTETEAAHKRLDELLPKIDMPVLLQQAGDDKIVEGERSKDAFLQFGSTDKTWQLIADEYHEIWFEVSGPDTFDNALDWVEGRIDT